MKPETAPMLRLLLAGLLLTLTLGAPRAARIALYDDPAWVSSGTPLASADSIIALLQGFGHTVSTFSGLTAARVSAGLAGADLVLIPEMFNYGQLVGELEPGALLALSAFVSAGGGLIGAGDYAHRLLNAVFYPACDFMMVYCFAGSGTLGASLLDATVAVGTPYAGAPADLGVPPQPLGVINSYAFFPRDGLNLYQDQDGGTTVLAAPFGAGRYGYLAWGYAGSVPNGTLDGGWAALMGIMVDDVAAPEPATALLLGGLLPLLAARRGRTRASARGSRLQRLEPDSEHAVEYGRNTDGVRS
ncbi:MAG TPA: hypothetical protein VES73_10525 [Lamprocystis sp. (in: g-proteobacteria)]|nr:hypothetical protein [Lamprocystis sp. (in: g-proteobacteria)]